MLHKKGMIIYYGQNYLKKICELSINLHICIDNICAYIIIYAHIIYVLV